MYLGTHFFLFVHGVHDEPVLADGMFEYRLEEDSIILILNTLENQTVCHIQTFNGEDLSK